MSAVPTVRVRSSGTSAPAIGGRAGAAVEPTPDSQAVWRRHAVQWAHVGAPLRPGPEDGIAVRRALAAWSAESASRSPAVMVLGVTPELCRLSAGASDRLVAVDRSADMIRAAWQPSDYPTGRVLCADWRALPCPAATFDVILGDGSFNALSYPDGYLRTLSELRRLLRPGGRCVLRCFVRPARVESPAEVFDDLRQGRVGNFHVLKWRLAMALQRHVDEGLEVDLVWRTLHREWPDPTMLAAFCRWPIEDVRTIEAYRGIATRYTFPSMAEWRCAFAAAGFAVRDVHVPGYELGDRCPTLLLEPAPGRRAR